MATYTTPATFAAGQALPFDDLNEVAQNTVAIKQGDTSLDKVTNAGATILSGRQNNTLAAGANNNLTVNATTTTLRITPDAGGTSTITGLTGGADGRVLLLVNITTDTYTLVNNSGSSSAGNKLILPGNANVTMGAADSIMLWYDSTSSVWRGINYA